VKPFDVNGAFRPPEHAVRELAIRGAGATLFSSGLTLVVQVISTVILARLLTPADFGLVTIVTTFSLLLVNFGGNGITEAVIQWGEVTDALASNLFWINVGAGVVLTLAFAASGSLLAWFFKDPPVARIAIGVSLSILATSVSVLHQALLKRAMRFPETSANEIISRALSLPIAILLAWAGWGYWALVANAVVQPLFQSIGAWYLCRWVPGRPRRVAGTASIMQFAMHVYGRFTVNYSARNLDNLLVGRFFQAQALGFYKKAYDLFTLPAGSVMSGLSNVAVSALSRLNHDLVQYKRFLLSALAVMAFVGMGLGVDLALIGKELIRLLLGPGWEPAGRIFTFFGPGIGIMFLYYTHGWIHLSIGRADRWFRWGIVEFVFTALLFVLALPWGPVGVAVAWTVSFWVLTVPAFWYAGKPINLGVGAVIAVVWRYILASLLAGGLCAAGIREFGLSLAPANEGAALARIVTISLSFGVLYLGAVLLLHQGFEPLQQVAGLVIDMVPWRMFSRPSPAVATVWEPEPGAPSPIGVSSEPLVSILIPAYNAENWIADTLRSALEQTWPRKEIIVVDDGSTDRTVEIARWFESAGVCVVTQNNLGGSAARNKAFSLSQGDYIQWLDADDLLAPDKIARQMDVARQCESKRVLLSSAWGKFIYRHRRATFIPTGLWSDLSRVEWLLCKMGQNVYMQTATWLVSRALTEAAGPWDTRLLGDDDGEYFCRVLLASEGTRFVPESRIYYRGPGVAFRGLSYIGNSTRKLDAHWLSMRLHIGYLLSLENSERTRAACLRFLQESLIYFYPERADILQQAEQMARELGGELGVPTLSWKYSWMAALFGWRLAKAGQEVLLKFRWSLEKVWDHALFRIERRKAAVNLGLERAGRSPVGERPDQVKSMRVSGVE
jgi:PST family polysaccharide transporter